MSKLFLILTLAFTALAHAEECGTITKTPTMNGDLTILQSDQGGQYTLHAANDDAAAFFSSAAENHAHVCVEGSVSSTEYNSRIYYSITNAQRAMN